LLLLSVWVGLRFPALLFLLMCNLLLDPGCLMVVVELVEGLPLLRAHLLEQHLLLLL
jgi:hypothetical protein